VTVEGPPVALPRTAWWDLCAGGDPGRAHRLLLGWPEAPPPPGGYPVLFLLDGNATFATALDAYRAATARPESPALAPALIVGLGHPGAAPFDRAARVRDYTPAAPDGPPGSGGADAFLDFLEGEAIPSVASRLPVNRDWLALFGHSVGGLLAVHALLARPLLFRRIAAASPSLWWGGGATLAAAAAMAPAPPGRGALVTAGALEGLDLGGPRGALRAARRTPGNARDLVGHLVAAGVPADYVEFAGEDHGSVRPAAIARAVRAVLPTPTPTPLPTSGETP